ncbi:hypothetical protein CKO28_19635 [Rhodovibrio sodomensis]|uniref:DUF6314 domain-containing protein n=1 Tax=Rhodovibrio sodomensis TaxID=1088 RepID=A0ABS1DID9_9PROT|nr:DUF6314 family protein [Rhodovibrio sodomensis]MBK1670245.1 hypothetical protein [Rhodovibrio sodomensis]
MTAPDPFDPPLPVADLRAFLPGTWRIVREIDDRRAGQRHVMHGTGTFAPAPGDPTGLVYDEEVVWAPAGQTMTGTRRYLIAGLRRASAVVLFADGRPFHALDLADGACAVHHDCPPDTYTGEYRVLDTDRFTVRWTVTGARKDSVLFTTFTRMA